MQNLLEQQIRETRRLELIVNNSAPGEVVALNIDDGAKAKQDGGQSKVIINNTYNGNEIQIFNSDRKEKFNNFKKQQTEILG